jgi:hypothetical protein
MSDLTALMDLEYDSEVHVEDVVVFRHHETSGRDADPWICQD